MAKKSAAPAASLRDHQRALDDAVERTPPVAVVFGEETFLRGEAVRGVLAALAARYPGIEQVPLRAGAADSGVPLDWAAFLGQFAGASLFASRKVLVLRDADKLFFPGAAATDDEDDDNAAPSAAAAPEPGRLGDPRVGQERFARKLTDWPDDTWLVAECAGVPKNRIVGKALAAHAVLIPCPAPTREDVVMDWLRDRAAARGHPLDSRAAHWLWTAHGGNLGALAGEIEKLSLYLENPDDDPADGVHRPITGEVVAAFLSGTEEFHAFALTNALEARDAREARRVVRLLTEQGGRDQGGKRRDAGASSAAMLARLPSTFLGLLAGGMAAQSGGGAEAVAAWLKCPPWRADKLARAGRLYRLPELRRAVERLAEETRAANDTGGDPRLALERSVEALLGRNNA